MATGSFIVFIVVVVLLARLINPVNEFIALGIGLAIPVVMLFLTVLIFGQGDGYKSGQITAQCLISTSVSIVLLVILLLRKLDRKRTNDNEPTDGQKHFH